MNDLVLSGMPDVWAWFCHKQLFSHFGIWVADSNAKHNKSILRTFPVTVFVLIPPHPLDNQSGTPVGGQGSLG